MSIMLHIIFYHHVYKKGSSALHERSHNRCPMHVYGDMVDYSMFYCHDPIDLLDLMADVWMVYVVVVVVSRVEMQYSGVLLPFLVVLTMTAIHIYRENWIVTMDDRRMLLWKASKNNRMIICFQSCRPHSWHMLVLLLVVLYEILDRMLMLNLTSTPPLRSVKCWVSSTQESLSWLFIQFKLQKNLLISLFFTLNTLLLLTHCWMYVCIIFSLTDKSKRLMTNVGAM